MRFTEYQSATKFSSDDVFLIDGTTNGSRKVAASEMMQAFTQQQYPAFNRRTFFRGKNLGTSVTDAQMNKILDGSFDDLCLGDYWVLGGVNYRIADFNYWMNTGDTKFTKNHLVIVPDVSLGTAQMNASSVTSGGYISSTMYTSGLSQAKATIQTYFSSYLLSHREYLINTVTSGYPSAGTFYDSTIELMNEPMVYGCYIYAPAGTGSNDVKRYTVSKTQLALFNIAPQFICDGTGYWLRDVASSTHFARIDSNGGATSTGAANTYGVRPVFAIGKSA